jgi:hypothetical protein
MALQYSTTLRNAMLDAVTAAAGSGALLKLYAGTEPASCAAADTGTLLGTLTCGSTLAPAASGGVLTANTITNDSAADATGTATYFRLCTSGGTVVLQGTVGTSGADVTIATTSVVANVIISCSSFTLTAAGA